MIRQMVNIYRHITLFFACLISLFVFDSCRHNSLNGDSPDNPDDGMSRLSIHISPVAARNGSGASLDKEMIKTLRIIIIHQNSSDNTSSDTTSPDTYVEYNEVITPDIEDGIRATYFSYHLLYRTTPGRKKFYFIANETSVNNWSVPDDVDLPEGISANSGFDELLDSFKNGNEKVDMLEKILNNMSFSFENSDITENGYIYLPYASVYDYITVDPKDIKEVDMYIVPAVAKFTFNFTNHRNAPVNIKGISLFQTNQKGYLLAKVGEKDYYKTLPQDTTKKLYWVDWLAMVSKLSQQQQNFSQNQNFNSLYGWISDYEIPDIDDSEEEFLFKATEEEVDGEILTLPIIVPETKITGEGTDDESEEPGFESVGPFYVAESINFRDPSTPSTGEEIPPQSYYLTLVWEDQGEGKEAPEFKNNKISNLQALFRNTHVVINIVMSQGDVMIYAQIRNWDEKTAYGWLTEGQKP